MTIERILFGLAALTVGCAALAGEPVKPVDVKKPAAAKPAAAAVTAQEKAVLAQLKRLYPATTFKSVSQTPVKGLFEVVMGPNVAYVSLDAKHFIFGHMFDMQRQVDLTEQRKLENPSSVASYERPQEERAKIVKVSELPLQDAIKRVNGNGSRTLIVFSDPLCPYCKRLEADLAQLEDTTIHTFLIPILGDNSRKAAESMWALAMPERATELEVIDRNLRLANRYAVNGTPALIRGDGEMVSGALPLRELNQWLGVAPVKPASDTKPGPAEKTAAATDR